MTKKKKTNIQLIVCMSERRELKTQQHEPQHKREVILGDSEW